MVQEGIFGRDNRHRIVGEEGGGEGGEAGYGGDGGHDGGQDGVLEAGSQDRRLPAGDRHQGGGSGRPARRDAQAEVAAAAVMGVLQTRCRRRFTLVHRHVQQNVDGRANYIYQPPCRTTTFQEIASCKTL